MAGMDPTARRRTIKLAGPVTRDKFITWDMNHRSFSRQFKEWRPFLPGTGTRQTWKSFTEDPTYGITIMKADPTQGIDENATNDMRSALQEFLDCLAAFCPEHYYTMVQTESTSYNWVMERIQEDYNLDSRGVRFLAGCDVKFSSSDDNLTYQQKFQANKEFYMSSLLKQGHLYKGIPLTHDEVLTPLGDNIIVEKWLDSIHTGLKSHIMQTRGHMFSAERPNLSDNQRQLCEQMEVLLKELEQKTDGPSVNRTGFQPQSQRRQQGGYPPQQRVPYQARPRTVQTRVPAAPSYPPNARTGCPPSMCIRCYEAGRTGAATRTHQASTCPHPRQNQRMRILLVPAGDQVHQAPRHQPAQIQEVSLTEDLLQQGDVYLDQEYEQEEYEDTQDLGHDFTNLSMNKPSYYYSSVLNANATQSPPIISLVPTRKIQQFTFLCSGLQSVLSLDSGCEGNCLRLDEAQRLGITISKLDANDRIPAQADGQTQLDTVGMAKTTFTRNGLTLAFTGYVIRDLSQPILCGLPFM